VRLDADGDVGPVDVRIADGVVVEVGARLRSLGEPELEASGVWALPGLWDAHVHFTQWVRSTTWLDVAGTRSAAEVCARVGAAASQAPPGRVLVGFGYRSAPWSRPGTVAELDAVSAGRPVVLVAGDAHNGWLNSAALSLLGVPRRDDPLAENEWFDVFPRLGDLPGGEPTTTEVARAVDLLASRGLTGIVDLDRSRSRVDSPADDYDLSELGGTLPTPSDDIVTLRVLVDHSMLEVFADGVPLTARVYPSRADAVGVRVRVEGQASANLTIWQMQRTGRR